MHGQRTTDSTTGTGPEGEAGSVPVVDLTLTVLGLIRHAEECRVRAAETLTAAHHAATALRAQADYLEDLATTLDGGHRG